MVANGCQVVEIGYLGRYPNSFFGVSAGGQFGFSADTEANALRAEIEALKAPKPILRVPTAGLLIAIERRGLTAQLDAIRAALPEGQKREFGLYMQFPETRRDHPLIAMVQQAFGWNDAQVDELFAEADQV